jgi:hypothetical protein
MKYLLLFFFSSLILAQEIDIEKYKEFLKEHNDIGYEELIELYPSTAFKDSNLTDYENSAFFEEFKEAFKPTEYELDLLGRNGFFVTERKAYPHFINGFHDVWTNDLPVYISTDAILHAWHYNFDIMIGKLEGAYVKPKLIKALDSMCDELKKIDTLELDDFEKAVVKATDLYLGYANRFINYDSVGGEYQLIFQENNYIWLSRINRILLAIEKGLELPSHLTMPTEVQLFSNNPIMYDFSHLVPNGRYNTDELKPYYFCMIWLGRTELRLDDPKDSFYDKQLQMSGSFLINKLIIDAGVEEEWQKIDEFLNKIIGPQDNIKSQQIDKVVKDLDISPFDLQDANVYLETTKKLKEFNSFNPLYSSNIILIEGENPTPQDAIPSFKLMGQRPVLDGFVTDRTTYDEIIYKGTKIKKMNPNTNEIMFALGNNASAQLLENDLKSFNYSDNLASARYLIDNLPEGYWEENLYASWLNTIRKYSQKNEDERDKLPAFMQTAAFAQKTLTTQHAAWAELRHDFYLYTKQPYTGSKLCDYPKFYVEPIPEIYENLNKTINIFKDIVDKVNEDGFQENRLVFKNYIDFFTGVLDTLEDISYKQLNNIELTDDEVCFGKNVLQTENVNFRNGVCGTIGYYGNFDGWYMRIMDLYDNGVIRGEVLKRSLNNILVTSYHTTPSDAAGNQVGWVHHAGTGPINMAVVSTKNADGDEMIFCGPVSSYYEVITEDFKRYTNDDWKVQFTSKINDLYSMRDDYELFSNVPKFSKYYLANRKGESYETFEKYKTKGNTIQEITSVEDNFKFELNAYPNPFKGKLQIVVSNNNLNLPFTMEIYDISGNIVYSKQGSYLPSGNSVLYWDGLNDKGVDSPKGAYFVKLFNEGFEETIKIIKE